MRDMPRNLDERDVVEALRSAWGIDVQSLTYMPVGFGSYHWTAAAVGGGRYFVTVDDLDRKPWLGADRDSAYDGLGSALDTARALRALAGLDFVLPPIPTDQDQSLARIAPQYALSLFPFVEAPPQSFSMETSAEYRPMLLRELAQLHQATPAVEPHARVRALEVPERTSIERALAELATPWTGGPYSERARAELAAHADSVRSWLSTFDDLAASVRAAGHPFVITHGEPHSGNQMAIGGRLLLIDWDTSALALPERDLWMLETTGSSDDFSPYVEAGGQPPDKTALALYRLAWTLSDVGSFLELFRSAHELTPDVEQTWAGLSYYLTR